METPLKKVRRVKFLPADSLASKHPEAGYRMRLKEKRGTEVPLTNTPRKGLGLVLDLAFMAPKTSTKI